MSVAERCGCNADARVVSITDRCGSVLRQRRCQSSTNRCRLSIELRYKYFDVSVYFIGRIGI